MSWFIALLVIVGVVVLLVWPLARRAERRPRPTDQSAAAAGPAPPPTATSGTAGVEPGGGGGLEAHQPGADERTEAELTGAGREAPDPGTLGLDDDAVEDLRARRPSSRQDPNRPDRPRT